MTTPFVSYITFNRLGLTVKSLSSLLNTPDKFELHIIDNNSTDGTWEYLTSLKDKRIVSKIKLPINSGKFHSLNLNLTKRQKDQLFISLDNTVAIWTKGWTTRIQKIFDTFPKLGLLSVLPAFPSAETLPPLTPRYKNGVFYMEINKEKTNPLKTYFPGECLYLNPKLINEIGYWSEENYYGHQELLFRVNRFTSFQAGFTAEIGLTNLKEIKCSQCEYSNKCLLDKSKETCFSIYNRLDKDNLFKEKFGWKFEETIRDMENGARPVYCASLHDAESISNRIFNMDWAIENLQFYIDNAN
ncbi:MAG TPA: glycosyltransferase [Peptococcaceae bacterium]|nr:glycosyltransferase [Peptococcaceae bacterium]